MRFIFTINSNKYIIPSNSFEYILKRLKIRNYLAIYPSKFKLGNKFLLNWSIT